MADLNVPLVESTEDIDPNRAFGDYSLTTKSWRSQTFGKLLAWINKVPAGGRAGQILRKVTNTDYDAAWQDAGDDELPVGGTTNQVLKKSSSLDGDVKWADESTGLPAGGNTGQVIIKDSSTEGDASWSNLPNELPDGGTAGQVLAKDSSLNRDVSWQDAGGVSNDDIDARIADWAEAGNTDPIPTGKLSQVALSGKLPVQSNLPTTGNTVGDIGNASGELEEWVASASAPNVYNGVVNRPSSRGANYVGDAFMQWQSTDNDNRELNIPKTAPGLASSQPATIYTEYHNTISGEYASLAWSRSSGSDTGTTYGYNKQQGGSGLDADDQAAPTGSKFTLTFYSTYSVQSGFSNPINIHAANRWEPYTRHIPKVAKEAIVGNTDKWPASKLELPASSNPSELVSVSSLPSLTGKSAGDMVDYNGDIYVVRAATEATNVYQGKVSSLPNSLVGDAFMQWSSSERNLYIPKTGFTSQPATIWTEFHDGSSYQTLDWARDPADDTSTAFAYTRPSGSDNIDPSPVGSRFSLTFYSNYTLSAGFANPLAVHNSIRWDLYIDIIPQVANEAVRGNTDAWPLDKIAIPSGTADDDGKALVWDNANSDYGLQSLGSDGDGGIRKVKVYESGTISATSKQYAGSGGSGAPVTFPTGTLTPDYPIDANGNLSIGSTSVSEENRYPDFVYVEYFQNDVLIDEFRFVPQETYAGSFTRTRNDGAFATNDIYTKQIGGIQFTGHTGTSGSRFSGFNYSGEFQRGTAPRILAFNNTVHGQGGYGSNRTRQAFITFDTAFKYIIYFGYIQALQGAQGPRGIGIPEGGTPGQIPQRTADATVWLTPDSGGNTGTILTTSYAQNRFHAVGNAPIPSDWRVWSLEVSYLNRTYQLMVSNSVFRGLSDTNSLSGAANVSATQTYYTIIDKDGNAFFICGDSQYHLMIASDVASITSSITARWSRIL